MLVPTTNCYWLEVKLKLKKLNISTAKPKIDVNILKCAVTKQKFELQLFNKFEVLEDMTEDSTEDVWQTWKLITNETASEVLG